MNELFLLPDRNQNEEKEEEESRHVLSERGGAGGGVGDTGEGETWDITLDPKVSVFVLLY